MSQNTDLKPVTADGLGDNDENNHKNDMASQAGSTTSNNDSEFTLPVDPALLPLTVRGQTTSTSTTHVSSAYTMNQAALWGKVVTADGHTVYKGSCEPSPDSEDSPLENGPTKRIKLRFIEPKVNNAGSGYPAPPAQTYNYSNKPIRKNKLPKFTPRKE